MSMTLLFLGAGASRPFGISTMTEMVEKFEKSLKDKNLPERTLYLKIKDSLSKGFDKSQIDLESVFSVIQGIASGTTAKKLGPLAFFYINKFSSDNKFSQKEIDDAKKLQKELESFIRNECKFNGSNETKALLYNNTYESLFKHLWGIKRLENKQGLKYSTGWKAFTTNYDLVFENFWEELTPLADFFSQKQSKLAYFDLNQDLNVQHSFVKIHGSLDWVKLEDGSIIKANPETYTRLKKKGTVMLYPIQQKDLYLHPWITLFQQLKRDLQSCDLWYVIGYAFNDEFIREIFIEAFSTQKRMIIINPSSNKIIEKFPEEWHGYITQVPIKFGDEYFNNDFQDFSKSQRTIHVDCETESQNVFLNFSHPVELIKIEKNEFEPYVNIETNENNRRQFEFRSRNNKNKKISLILVLREDSKQGYDVELGTRVSHKKNVSITIRSQKRILDVYTITKWDDDSLYPNYCQQNQKISGNKIWLGQ